MKNPKIKLGMLIFLCLNLIKLFAEDNLSSEALKKKLMAMDAEGFQKFIFNIKPEENEKVMELLQRPVISALNNDPFMNEKPVDPANLKFLLSYWEGDVWHPSCLGSIGLEVRPAEVFRVSTVLGMKEMTFFGKTLQKDSNILIDGKFQFVEKSDEPDFQFNDGIKSSFKNAVSYYAITNATSVVGGNFSLEAVDKKNKTLSAKWLVLCVIVPTLKNRPPGR